MSLAEYLVNNEYVLAYFWSEICISCINAVPFLDKMENAYKKLKVVRLNTQIDLDLAISFEIDTLPTFIIFRNSKEIGRIIGFRLGPIEIERRIRKLIM